MNGNNLTEFPIDQFFNSDNSLNSSTKSDSAKTKQSSSLTSFLNVSSALKKDSFYENFNAQDILSKIEDSLDPKRYQTVFKNIEITIINNRRIAITTESIIQKIYIEENYMDLLYKTLGSCGFLNVKIILKVKETQVNNSLKQKNHEKKQKPFRFKLDGSLFQESKNESKVSHNNSNKLTDLKNAISNISSPKEDSVSLFNNITTGTFNKLAYTSLKSVSTTPGKNGKYPFIYLYGLSGVGKTQLLDAVAHDVLKNFPDYKILKVSAREFIKDLVNGYKNNNIDAFFLKYNDNIDFFIIDEVQELKSKEGSQNHFYNFFNDLFYKGKQIIVCSNENPKELKGFDDKLKSRLQWGLTIKIDKPDLDTRIKILKEKSCELDIFLSDDIISFLASFYSDNIRELEGAILSLSAYTEIMNTEIDIEIAREILSIKTKEKIISIEDIANKVSEYFAITLTELISKSRKKDHVLARHIAWYLTREILKVNLIEIADYYNRKDHTTILYGINKISSNLKIDINISKTILKIKHSL